MFKCILLLKDRWRNLEGESDGVRGHKREFRISKNLNPPSFNPNLGANHAFSTYQNILFSILIKIFLPSSLFLPRILLSKWILKVSKCAISVSLLLPPSLSLFLSFKFSQFQGQDRFQHFLNANSLTHYLTRANIYLCVIVNFRNGDKHSLN